MPASKKVWIHDGHIARYPTVLAQDSVHQGESCTDCHLGVDSVSSRSAAHSGGFSGIPDATNCSACHNAEVTSAASGLHTTLAGYDSILESRGFNFSDPTSLARFEQQCTSCHVATGSPTPATACGHCHVSVPSTAGGGLLAAHAFVGTPSSDSNCTACHGSRVKDEFYGLNNELLASNKEYFDTGLPWKDAGFELVPDVHKTAGMECVTCHSEQEMHGDGAPTSGDRYDVTTVPTCNAVACHGDVTNSNSMHTGDHVGAMDCQVCHAQPYKNCFECHTDITAANLPFYSISDNAPSGDHAHLMAFRAGVNPRYTGSGRQKEYSLLRHVPVDGDTFKYSGTNEVTGLFSQLANASTWKHATPHNIIRNTVITQACANCHGASYTNFWLTDAVEAAQGWVSTSNETFETTANGSVTISAPFSMKD